MRYRWKLLALLLITALLPIMAGGILGVRAVRNLGDTLVTHTRQYLTAQTENRLRILADGYSSVVSEGREMVGVALLAQAMEVEHRLKEEPSAIRKVLFSEDFDAVKATRGAIVRGLPARSLTDQGGLLPVAVSHTSQVFSLAPGVDREKVAADMSRLAAMTPFYRKLSTRLRGRASWHFTGLENGVHAAYPGHGGIPKGFDPRKEPWYSGASHAIKWTDQYTDPETGRMVVAASMPVRRPDGAFAGVTALVLPAGALLEHRLLDKNVPPSTRSFITYPTTRPETGARAIRITARQQTTDTVHRSWTAEAETQWLSSSDTGRFQKVLDDFASGSSNVVRMPYGNCDCLWVYRPMNFNAFLVLITPYAEILQPAQEAEKQIKALMQDLIEVTGKGMVVLVLVICVLALLFSRTVTKPLRILAEGTRRLGEGLLDTKVNIRSRDEFGDMGRVFNTVGSRLQEHYRMRQSLELAMEVQQSFMPKDDPKIEGLDISGKSIYCEETGGDYYDYLETGRTEEKKILVVVGDVSDHGIQSALLMTTARAFLRQRSSRRGSIAHIVSDVNVQLARDVRGSGRFMTLFFAEVDARNRRFRWVCAGHDPALVYDRCAGTFEEFGGRDLVLGVFEDAHYHESQRAIRKGQIIVIGTDGIWEAHDPSGEMFGKERLKAIIRRHAAEPARAITEAVIEAVERFRAPLETEDDITLVVIKVEQ